MHKAWKFFLPGMDGESYVSLKLPQLLRHWVPDTRNQIAQSAAVALVSIL